MITRTHNAYHLGDNLVHLHFMRKVALSNPDREFIHAAQWQYLAQLRDVVEDVPNLSLTEFGYMLPSDSINAWRGDKQFWYSSPIRNDFVRFHVEQWFPYLCDRMSVENPIKKREDMLFDYPPLKLVGCKYRISEWFEFPLDILVINSPPSSGQFSDYQDYRITNMALDMQNKGLKVLTTHRIDGFGNLACTADRKLSVTQIGYLSLHCHAIIMVSTGPSWPTFNVWNRESVRHRVVLLEPERVNLAPNTTHCATIDEASEVLKGIGLL